MAEQLLNKHTSLVSLIEDEAYKNMDERLQEEAVSRYVDRVQKSDLKILKNTLLSYKHPDLDRLRMIVYIAKNRDAWKAWEVVDESHDLYWFKDCGDRYQTIILLDALYETIRLGGCCIPGHSGFRMWQILGFCQRFGFIYHKGKYNKYMIATEERDWDLVSFTGADKYKPWYSYDGVLTRNDE
jgi:hypothetical protein